MRDCVHQGNQSSGCSHNDVYTFLYRLLLLRPGHAVTTAIDGHRARIRKVGKSFYLLVNLQTQLSGGGQNQSTDVISGLIGDVTQSRQNKRCSFTGSRLGAGNQIMAVQNDRNRLLLDWCWFVKTHHVEAFLQVCMKIKMIETQLTLFKIFLHL